MNLENVERIKAGIREAGKLYGYVKSIYGTVEYVDIQVREGLEKGLFPFPVYYAIKFEPGEKFKLLRIFLEKDLTEGTLSEYINSVADPNHWRSGVHADAMDKVMKNF